eukprot:993512-Pelagomonas_calceolata.AAC.5
MLLLHPALANVARAFEAHIHTAPTRPFCEIRVGTDVQQKAHPTILFIDHMSRAHWLHVPTAHWSRVPIAQCSHVPVAHCSHVPIAHWSRVLIAHCSHGGRRLSSTL